jgi:hypothetical protein
MSNENNDLSNREIGFILGATALFVLSHIGLLITFMHRMH